MTEQTKAWGHTKEILTTSFFEIHKIFVERGGYCSIHRHVAKHNSFYILYGVLQITEWKDDSEDDPDHRLLRTDDLYTCRRGVKHRFRALSEVGALEIYHTEVDPGDIVRYSQGGSDWKKDF